MTSIRNTIATALAEQGVNAEYYSNEIDIVAGALQEREYTIREQIIEAAAEHGSDYEDEAVRILTAVGVEVRPIPEPEPVTEAEPASENERLDRIEAAVKSLLELASRHLGSDIKL